MNEIPEPDKILVDLVPVSLQDLVEKCISTVTPNRSPGLVWLHDDNQDEREAAVAELAKLGYAAIVNCGPTAVLSPYGRLRPVEQYSISTWEPKYLLQAIEHAQKCFEVVCCSKRKFHLARTSSMRRWLNDLDALGVDMTGVSDKVRGYRNLQSPAHTRLHEAIDNHKEWVKAIETQPSL